MPALDTGTMDDRYNMLFDVLNTPFKKENSEATHKETSAPARRD
jgi:hypothetical protein